MFFFYGQTDGDARRICVFFWCGAAAAGSFGASDLDQTAYRNVLVVELDVTRQLAARRCPVAIAFCATLLSAAVYVGRV